MKVSIKNATTAALAAMAVLSSTSLLAKEKHDLDVAPKIITPGSPGDPKYANGGENFASGVGSIFIEFDSLPEGRGFICTASAISPTHLLTAAHCVRSIVFDEDFNPVIDDEGNTIPDTLKMITFLPAGSESFENGIAAVGFSVHPYYDALEPLVGAFAPGDVAVVELAQSLQEGTAIYDLYEEVDEFGQDTRHYGHGRSGTGNKGATGSASFYYARTGLNQYEQVLAPLFGGTLGPLTPLFDQLMHDFDSGGRKHNAMEWWYTSAFMCAPEKEDNPAQAQDGQCTTFKDGSYPDFKGYGKYEVGIAPGDSGGPGFIDGKIAGVHSFGVTHFCEGVTNGTDFTCGLDSSYGELAGDTRVSSYIDWIDSKNLESGFDLNVPEAAPPMEAEPARFDAAVFQSAGARFFLDNVEAKTMRGKALVQIRK